MRGVEALLERKGLVDAQELDRALTAYLARASPAGAAKMVARAWVDDGFRERLLADANATLPEVGLSMGGGLQEQRLKVLENTATTPPRRRLHAVLLLPDRAARAEPDLVQVRGLPVAGRPRPPLGARASSARRCRTTWRSPSGTPAPSRATRCCRSGPAGTDGLDEEQLAALVTRNGLIGVAAL